MCETQDYFALSQIISVVLFTQSTINNLSNIIILSGVSFLERNPTIIFFKKKRAEQFVVNQMIFSNPIKD